MTWSNTEYPQPRAEGDAVGLLRHRDQYALTRCGSERLGGEQLLGLANMEAELTALVGRTVDLRTPNDLSRYFRDSVIDRAEVQFARR